MANYGVMNRDTIHQLFKRAFEDGIVIPAFQDGEPALADADYYGDFLLELRQYNRRGTQQANGCVMDKALYDPTSIQPLK